MPSFRMRTGLEQRTELGRTQYRSIVRIDASDGETRLYEGEWLDSHDEAELHRAEVAAGMRRTLSDMGVTFGPTVQGDGVSDAPITQSLGKAAAIIAALDGMLEATPHLLVTWSHLFEPLRAELALFDDETLKLCTPAERALVMRLKHTLDLVTEACRAASSSD